MNAQQSVDNNATESQKSDNPSLLITPS